MTNVFHSILTKLTSPKKAERKIQDLPPKEAEEKKQDPSPQKADEIIQDPSPQKADEIIQDPVQQPIIDFEHLGENISNLNLGIANGGNLNNEVVVLKKRTVFFPVVPRGHLSIIHLVFAQAIKGLTSYGLNVKVFVFDDYYRRVKHYSKPFCKEITEGFISELSKRGIDKDTIVLESDLLNRPTFAQKLLFRIRDLCSRKTIKEIQQLRELTSSYIKDDSLYIRQEKILYNLAYASLFDNIGFVLCGADEVPLWRAFIDLETTNHYGATELSQLIVLYIPKMKNSSKDEKSNWDEENICTATSKDYIKKKLTENLEEQFRHEDCGVFYLLQNLYFSHNSEYKFTHDDKRTILVKNVDELIKEIELEYNNETKDIPEMVKNDLVDCIYKILHEYKEDEQND